MKIHHPRLSLYVIVFLSVCILPACRKSTSPSAVSLTSTPIKALAPTNTSSPTAEPTAKPNILPDAKLYTINIDRPVKTPQDLLEQLYGYVPQLGGGGPLIEKGPAAWIDPYNDATIPAVPQDISWRACNLSESPAPQVTLTLPDSTSLQPEVNYTVGEMNRYNCVWLSYVISPGAPLGRYAVELKQNDTLLTDSVTLALPTQPVEVYYQDNRWFAGFQPNEQVTLSYYLKTSLDELERSSTLVALFQDVAFLSTTDFSKDASLSTSIYLYVNQYVIHADENGAFQVKLTSNIADLQDFRLLPVVQGETSYLNLLYQSQEQDVLCTKALPTRLKPGDIARITDYGDPSQLSAKGFQHGDTVSVLYGPYCDFHERMGWIVRRPDGVGFFALESDAERYFLRPITSAPFGITTDTPQPAIPTVTTICPDSLPSRLSLGLKAEVTTSGKALQLSLRSVPGFNANAVHVIAAGRDMVILDGPTCLDGSSWWYIRSEQGFEGWAPEGDSEDYWIDPIQ